MVVIYKQVFIDVVPSKKVDFYVLLKDSFVGIRTINIIVVITNELVDLNNQIIKEIEKI